MSQEKSTWIDAVDFYEKYGYTANGRRTLKSLPDKYKRNKRPNNKRAVWSINEKQALKHFEKHSRI